MTITAALLGSAGSTTSASTVHTTISVTPPANRVVLLALCSRVTSIRCPTSVTGWGVPWRLVSSHTNGDRNMSLWRCFTGASPTAGAVTITFSLSVNATSYHFIVLDGVDTVAPIRQFTSATIGAGTTASLALANSAMAGNAVLGLTFNSIQAAFTPGSGWTELSDTWVATPLAMQFQTQFRGDVLDPSPDWSIPGSNYSTGALMAVELVGASVLRMTAQSLAMGYDDADLTSYNTPSLTSPSASRVVALLIANSVASGTAPAVSSVSGWSTTWTQVATQTHHTSSGRRLSLWWALAPATVTGALSIDFGAVTQTGISWQLIEFQGVSTTAPFVNAITGGSIVTAASGMVTLAAPPAAGNAVFSCMAMATNAAFSAEAGHIPLTAFSATANTVTELVAAAWHHGSDDPSVTWTFGATVTWAAIAVELVSATFTPAAVSGDAAISGAAVLGAIGVGRYAPLSLAVQTTGGSSSGATTYTTAVVAPPSGQTLILTVLSTNLNEPGDSPSSITGLGLTWVKAGESAYDIQFGPRITVWWAFTPPTPVTPGALTITFPAAQDYGCVWNLAAVAEAHPTIPLLNPVAAHDAGPETNAAAVTLLSIDPGNAAFGAVAKDDSSLTITPEAGFTELGEGVDSTNTLNVAWRNNFDDLSIGWTWTGSTARWAALGLELNSRYPTTWPAAAQIGGQATLVVAASQVSTRGEAAILGRGFLRIGPPQNIAGEAAISAAGTITSTGGKLPSATAAARIDGKGTFVATGGPVTNFGEADIWADSQIAAEGEASHTGFEVGLIDEGVAFGPSIGIGKIGFNLRLIDGGVAFGPYLTLPALIDPYAPMQVSVIDRVYGVLGTLATAYGRTWLDTLNDTGSASLTLPNDSPEISWLSTDRLLRFDWKGITRFVAVIESINRSYLPAGEEAEMVTQVEGRGLLALLEEGRVHPNWGVRKLPKESTRVFNFAAPQYNAGIGYGWWGPSTEITRQGNRSKYYTGLPYDWPDPDARWIWDWRGSQEWAPTGTCYFRRQSYWPYDGAYRIFFGTDNNGELFLDGQKILTCTANYDDPTESANQIFEVSAGWHQLAAWCWNDPDPEGDYIQNPGGIIVSAIFLNGDRSLGPVVARTDGSWVCNAYPPHQPGMTPGEVMRVLLSEAQARGECAGITLGFTDWIDSHGNPWPETTDISARVGDDILAVIKALCDTYLDVWMSPGKILYAWNRNQRGFYRNVTLHQDVTNPANSDFESLTHTVQNPTSNAILIEWEKAWTEVVDGVSAFWHGRRGGLLTLGHITSEAEALAIGTQYLYEFSGKRVASTANLGLSTPGRHPYENFDVADWVVLPDDEGVNAWQRCRALGYAEDENGDPLWRAEFRDLLLEADDRWGSWLKRMAAGAAGGEAQNVGPPPNPLINTMPKVRIVPLFHFQGAVVTATSDAWHSTVTATVVSVAATLTKAGGSPTVVQLIMNGAVVATVTIPAKQKDARSGLAPTWGVASRRIGSGDELWVRCTKAGSGAEGLVVDVAAV